MLKNTNIRMLPIVSDSDPRLLETNEESEEEQLSDINSDPLRFIETTKELESILYTAPDNRINYKRNIYDDCRAEIERIYNSEFDELVVALMGSGKTYALIRTALENNIKVILTVPLRINDQQLAKIHSLISRRDLWSDSEIKSVLSKETFMICVYDSLPKVYNALKELNDLKNWIVIVDEIHNFVSQADFRYKALRQMRYLLPQFKKRIYVTGTEEGSIQCLKTYSKNLKVNYFEPFDAQKSIGKLKLFYTTKSTMDLLLWHLINNRLKGLTVIAIDNKESLELLAKKLKSFFPDAELEILNSDLKEGKLYSELITTNLINIKDGFLLTTSVISDGCNVDNTNLVAVYAVNWRDLNKLKQLYSRFRKADASVIYYDIFKTNEVNKEKPLIDVEKTFKKKIEYLAERVTELNNPAHKKPYEDYEHLPSGEFCYKIGDQIILDQFFIQHEIMNDLFVRLNNPLQRTLYYEKFSNFLVEDISSQEMHYNDDDLKVINGVVRADSKSGFFSFLNKNANALPSIIRKINDKRIKAEKYTPEESQISEFLENEEFEKLLNDFNYLNEIINNPGICIRLISYPKTLLKQIKDWVSYMDIYYKVKNVTQRNFPREKKADSNIIREIIKSKSETNTLVPNDLKDQLKITKHILMKYIDFIFKYDVDPETKRNKKLINISERSLADILPEDKLFLYDEDPIDIPANSTIFGITEIA